MTNLRGFHQQDSDESSNPMKVDTLQEPAPSFKMIDNNEKLQEFTQSRGSRGLSFVSYCKADIVQDNE
ncbi:18647_t:CDS:2 [Funneliformis geosporum]|uniref:18647_t:CDS:1 n=1 Tax=Funneliformis geosporum TaxID=1117311 RepID=A0A9W4SHN4_9GLOM|nr:18647_t:CDS:2 [Funneliformis geosporum]